MAGHRRTIRLKGYNYSSKGFYFITICVKYKEPKFGNVVEQDMKLNKLGNRAFQLWNSLQYRFSVKCDEFQIMPNHIHGILEIIKEYKGKRSLISQCVGYFKANLSKEAGEEIWQRNYYERIIRNERELWAIRNYIKNNPKNLEKDIEFGTGES